MYLDIKFQHNLRENNIALPVRLAATFLKGAKCNVPRELRRRDNLLGTIQVSVMSWSVTIKHSKGLGDVPVCDSQTFKGVGDGPVCDSQTFKGVGDVPVCDSQTFKGVGNVPVCDSQTFKDVGDVTVCDSQTFKGVGDVPVCDSQT
ncbi:hypothetical protein Btru_016752 [Bulinus truncatus]|nr:hypothetical protein Btru_016752 [Bulinus truncatus]